MKLGSYDVPVDVLQRQMQIVVGVQPVLQELGDAASVRRGHPRHRVLDVVIGQT